MGPPPPPPGPDSPPRLRDTRHFLSHWYDCWHRLSCPGTPQRQGRGQGRPCRSRPWALAPVGLALAPQGGPSPWVAVRLYVRVSYGVLPPQNMVLLYTTWSPVWLGGGGTLHAKGGPACRGGCSSRQKRYWGWGGVRPRLPSQANSLPAGPTKISRVLSGTAWP